MSTTTHPINQSQYTRGGGFQPPVTCYNPEDLDQPAQTTLYEIMRDCDHMLTGLQIRLLAIATDKTNADGVACLPVARVAENMGMLRQALYDVNAPPKWNTPTALEVASEFAAIAELGLIAMATVGSPEHFLVFVGTPHHQSAVVRAAAEFINSTFDEQAVA